MGYYNTLDIPDNSQCHARISCGIVAYRVNNEGDIEYLMIQRKDSIGFMDICTGKYSTNNKGYIIKLLKHCRIDELECFNNLEIPYMVRNLRLLNKLHNLYSKHWFNKTVNNIINRKKSGQIPKSLGWGFPKGQRNIYESDFKCAIREFQEETNYDFIDFRVAHKRKLYDRFVGINGRRYEYRYYIATPKVELHDPFIDDTNPDQHNEIRNIKWVTYEKIYHKLSRMSQRVFMANVHKVVKSIVNTNRTNNIY